MVFLSFAGASGSDAAERPLSLQELLAKMAEADRERMASLHDYSSVRWYTLENKRFGTTAEIQVRMTYRQSGTKAFDVLSEKGPRVIRNRVLRRLIKTELEAARPEVRASTQISAANYVFSFLGTETDAGQQFYLLQLEPRRPSKFLFRGRIRVTSGDFAIARIDGAPATSPSFWVKSTTFTHTYQKFGRVWLPVSNLSESDARVFGRTEVRVEYKDYRLNEGESGAKDGTAPGAERIEIDESDERNGASGFRNGSASTGR